MPKTPDSPKTEAELRKELKLEYEANLQEEVTKVRKMFEGELASFGQLDPDDPATANKVRGELLQLIPESKDTLSWLLNHASSEAVRAGIAKFVFVEAIGKAKSESQEDELRDLLTQVRKQD
jgi:hypothetical protein